MDKSGESLNVTVEIDDDFDELGDTNVGESDTSFVTNSGSFNEFLTSTPVKEQKGAKGKRSKKPPPPPKLKTSKAKGGTQPKARSNTEQLQCSKCRKYLKTVVGLRNHQQLHEYEDAAAKLPPAKDICDSLRSYVPDILRSIKNERAVGDLWSRVSEVCEEALKETNSDKLALFSEALLNIVSKGLQKKVVMPSAIEEAVTAAIAKEWANDTRRDTFVEILCSITPCKKEVACSLVWQCLQMSSEKLLSILFQKMLSASGGTVFSEDDRRVRSKDNFDSVVDKSTVFNIAGACLRGFFKTSLKRLKDRKWVAIREMLIACFIKESVPVATADAIEAWTAALNRKSLIFVKEQAANFFFSLAKVLSSSELVTGGLQHEAVQKKVFSTPDLVYQWDMIVGDKLKQSLSQAVLSRVVKSFTNTYGHGVLLRRINKEYDKGAKAASLGTRALLAS